MRHQAPKFATAAGLLTAAPASWAHPALFDGSVVATLAHLLTEPDHLFILAAAGLAAGIIWHIKRKA